MEASPTKTVGESDKCESRRHEIVNGEEVTEALNDQPDHEAVVFLIRDRSTKENCKCDVKTVSKTVDKFKKALLAVIEIRSKMCTATINSLESDPKAGVFFRGWNEHGPNFSLEVVPDSSSSPPSVQPENNESSKDIDAMNQSPFPETGSVLASGDPSLTFCTLEFPSFGRIPCQNASKLADSEALQTENKYVSAESSTTTEKGSEKSARVTCEHQGEHQTSAGKSSQPQTASETRDPETEKKESTAAANSDADIVCLEECSGGSEIDEVVVIEERRIEKSTKPNSIIIKLPRYSSLNVTSGCAQTAPVENREDELEDLDWGSKALPPPTMIIKVPAVTSVPEISEVSSSMENVQNVVIQTGEKGNENIPEDTEISTTTEKVSLTSATETIDGSSTPASQVDATAEQVTAETNQHCQIQVSASSDPILSDGSRNANRSQSCPKESSCRSEGQSVSSRTRSSARRSGGEISSERPKYRIAPPESSPADALIFPLASVELGTARQQISPPDSSASRAQSSGSSNAGSERRSHSSSRSRSSPSRREDPTEFERSPAGGAFRCSGTWRRGYTSQERSSSPSEARSRHRDDRDDYRGNGRHGRSRPPHSRSDQNRKRYRD